MTANSTFQFLVSVDSNRVPVTKYRCTETGLTVVVAKVPGPLVNLFCTLATEAHDDAGCPHTLEHLIFLGSEQYPYKGTLDTLANLAIAQGTNAWTATDHTAYTVTTAGSEGFLKLLPIYMDHILNPTITASGCVTEVYHVTGEGKDAGVVYCEMEAIENSAHNVARYEMGRRLFPGDSGYKAETGGRLQDIRGLTVETIRQYHRDYYRPDNMAVVVVGDVDPEDIFAALAPTVQGILAKKSTKGASARPWFVDMAQHAGPSSSSSVSLTFPSDDASAGGFVSVGWRGPARWDDFETHAALHALLVYLTKTSESPLRKEFVDTAEAPSCTSVSYSAEQSNGSNFTLDFDNTLRDRHDSIPARLLALLGSHEVDMGRMRDIIHNEHLRAVAEREDDPAEFYARSIIDDFVYGTHPSHLAASLDLEVVRSLLTKPAAYWQALLRDYLVAAPHQAVLCSPSAEAAKALEDSNLARVDERKARLGEAGLAGLAAALDEACERNNVPLPEAVVAAFGSADPANVRAATPAVAHPAPGVSLVAIPTAFVTLRAVVDTRALTADERLLSLVFARAAFESSVELDGAVVPRAEAVRRMDADLLEKSCSHGQLDAIEVRVRAEAGKAERALGWLRAVLLGLVFEADRLLMLVKKEIQQRELIKRRGGSIVSTAVRRASYDPAASVLLDHGRVVAYLRALAKRLEAEPAAVLADLAGLRRTLLHGQGHVHFAVIASPEVLASRLWARALREGLPHLPEAPPRLAGLGQHLLPAARRELASLITARGIGSSGYLLQVAEGPHSRSDPAVVPILVAIEAICGLESFFWKEIRGAGLSYNYSLSVDVDYGTISFCLNRATNVAKAFEAARRILTDLTEGRLSVSRLLLLAGRAQVVFDLVSQCETQLRAAYTVLRCEMAGLPADQISRDLAALSHVTEQVVVQAIATWIHPVLSAKALAVALSPDKCPEQLKAFADQGMALQETSLNTALGLPEVREESGEGESESESEEEDGEDE